MKVAISILACIIPIVIGIVLKNASVFYIATAILTTSLLGVCIAMYQRKQWSIDKHYDIFLMYFGMFFYAVYWALRDTFFIDPYHTSEYIGSLLPLILSFIFYVMRYRTGKPLHLYLVISFILAIHILMATLMGATDNELMFVLALVVSATAYEKKHWFILPVLVGFIFYQGYVSMYYYLIHDGTYAMQLIGMTPYIATLIYANLKIWRKLWKS